MGRLCACVVQILFLYLIEFYWLDKSVSKQTAPVSEMDSNIVQARGFLFHAWNLSYLWIVHLAFKYIFDYLTYLIPSYWQMRIEFPCCPTHWGHRTRFREFLLWQPILSKKKKKSQLFKDWLGVFGYHCESNWMTSRFGNDDQFTSMCWKGWQYLVYVFLFHFFSFGFRWPSRYSVMFWLWIRYWLGMWP